MFQNRRTIFLFVCSIVFIQALYYIVTLQIKTQQQTIIESSSLLISTAIQNQSSDRYKSSVQPSQTSINTSNLMQVSQLFDRKCLPIFSLAERETKLLNIIYRKSTNNIKFYFRLIILLYRHQQIYLLILH